MELKTRTPNGLFYTTMKDMEPVCIKCKHAYNSDFTVLDCFYCPIPPTLDLMKEYAYRLDKVHE